MGEATQLTEEAKSAIRKYMLAMIAVPGVVLSIVAFAMGYLINDVAKQSAYHDAYKDASGRILNLSEQVAMAVSDARSQAKEIAEIQSKLRAVDNEATEMHSKIKTARAVADAFSSTQNVVEAVKVSLVQDQKFSAKIKKSVIGISKIKNSVVVSGDVDVPKNKWGRAIEKIGYGNGVHAWKNKSVSCPDGHYVVGIEVTHGGTCDRKCDPDGAVIREIKLVCRGL